MAFFDSSRLNWPNNGDINAWADFVETVCMFSEDNRLPLEDFVDFIKDDGTKTPKQVVSALNFNETYLLHSATPSPPIVDSEEFFDGDDEENEDREKIRSSLLVLFSFIQSRSQYFGSFYPFEIERGTEIKLQTALTDLQHLYIILLLSSEMNLFNKGDGNRLGHRFEALCEFPFTALLPKLAQRKFFGAGGGKIMPADYSGNLRSRLSALAADLHISPKPIIDDPDEIGPTGDAGLDWVGWVSFDDQCDHQPVYFGQCACGSNWIDKQHETSLSIWQNYLDLNQSVHCFHFMPRSFRRNSLNWFRVSDIVRELTLIDRYRLLKLFEEADIDTVKRVLVIYADLLAEADHFEYESEG